MMTIEWQKRRKRTDHDLGTFWRRYDTDRDWVIIECHSRYGGGYRVLLARVTQTGEKLVSRHRSAKAAQEAVTKRRRKAR